MPPFKVVSQFSPSGDQPQAIRELTEATQRNAKFQTLLGVTGSGKTFTMAHVVQNVQRPTLVISHNKTLAAQLYNEFRSLFPHNAVEYFVSYYDYYQPEAYIPATDTYIAKDSRINDELDRLRLRATCSLLSRRDTIIVASVSCIYNIGSPQEHAEMVVMLKKGQIIERDDILRGLVRIQYNRNDIDFSRGAFRVRGDVVEVFPAYDDTALRIQMFDREIEKISRIDPLRGHVIEELDEIAVFPARYFVTTRDRTEAAILTIQTELDRRLAELRRENKLVEAQRLESRTKYDIEMIREIGYCAGIENYSRHFDARLPESRPYTLLDFFPKDYLIIIDESHVSIPQIGGMFLGDRSRKGKLVEYGFRLPSALDNRPLKLHEFEELINQAIFVSATPGDYELEKSGGVVVEQVIRPTGLVDPEVVIKPVHGQIDDLLEEIRIRVERKERTLVTTLTKRMAENLAEYLNAAGIKVRYLHSEIETIERTDILRDLRIGEFDVLVGINLLREGLDLPEVSLVAVLDADKEGFLRSTRSLIQTSGRAARNINDRVVMYADTITESMHRAIEEMNRRRQKQTAYNKEKGITPKTIYRKIEERMVDNKEVGDDIIVAERFSLPYNENKLGAAEKLRNEMLEAASKLEFEKAAKLRDKIRRLEAKKEGTI